MTTIPQEDARIIQLATYASVTTAAFLIAMKFFGWWVTHSVSLQASLIDSLLDAFASFINMVAVYQALKPADKEHRYGHGKAESLAGLGQALFIGASSIWLLYEAIERFTTPEPVEATGTGILIMGTAIFITLFLVGFQNYVVKKTGSTAIAADMIHYRSDILINTAVIISLSAAKFFQAGILDSIFGIVIGAYIFWCAGKIMIQAFNVLMDRELDDAERKIILTIIKSHPKVIEVRDLRTRTSGLQQFFQLNIIMDPKLSLHQADLIAEEVETDVTKAFPKSQVMIRLVPEEPPAALKTSKKQPKK